MIDTFKIRYPSYFLHKKRVSIIPIQLYFSVVSGKNTHITPQRCLFYRMVIRICWLNNPLGTVIFLQPTSVGCTARTCKLYSPRMCDEQPALVGYKLIAIQVELLSHDGQIYMDSLLQKQAILRLSDLYSAILLMRDTLFLMV